MEWKKKSDAPTDGTIIIAVYEDMSGVFMTRYGRAIDGDKALGWFDADYSDTSSEFSLWTPCPTEKPRLSIMNETLAPSPYYQGYIDFINNTAQVPLSAGAFNKDWEPVGEIILKDMESQGFIRIIKSDAGKWIYLREDLVRKLSDPKASMTTIQWQMDRMKK